MFERSRRERRPWSFLLLHLIGLWHLLSVRWRIPAFQRNVKECFQRWWLGTNRKWFIIAFFCWRWRSKGKAIGGGNFRCAKSKSLSSWNTRSWMWWRFDESTECCARWSRKLVNVYKRKCAQRGVSRTSSKNEGNLKLLHCHSSWWLIIRLLHIFVSDACSLADSFSWNNNTGWSIQTRIMDSFECNDKVKGLKDASEVFNLSVSSSPGSVDDNYFIIYCLIWAWIGAKN